MNFKIQLHSKCHLCEEESVDEEENKKRIEQIMII